VFLNFGRQRAYKSPGFAADVFRALNRQDSFLFTIGPADASRTRGAAAAGTCAAGGPFKKLLRLATGGPRTGAKTLSRTVPPEEIPRILAACDCMFLGHSAGLNSGLLALAASYGKPVVFPDIGNFRDQLQGWEWHEPYAAGDAGSALGALIKMLGRIAGRRPGDVAFDNRQWLDAHAWSRHVDMIVEAVTEHKKNAP